MKCLTINEFVFAPRSLKFDNHKEKTKVSARDIVATVQVQVAPKSGDNLLKATAETEVITAMIGVKPGENLFREKKRGRPCKELLQQQQDQALQNLHFKLNRFTPTDKKFVLERFDEMLGSILLSLLKGGGKGEEGAGADEESRR